MKPYDFFYDGQIRRFLLQIVRAFSGFQYEVISSNGKELRNVPCRLATQNRQVAHILKSGSENTMAAFPLITVMLKETSVARDRTQAPGLVTSVHVRERARENGELTGNPGNKITVERLMPHPIDLTIQVDVWTTNEHQKHQLWEQIFMMFNVAFPIQSSDNPLDWSALTTMELIDSTWTSRSLPSGGGADEIIDACTFNFKLPIWISPPAKIKKQKLIHQIITNISHSPAIQFDNPDVDGYFTSALTPEKGDIQFITTDNNAVIEIKDGFCYLHSDGGVPLNWGDVLKKHGLTFNNTRIHLKTDIESKDSTDIVFKPVPTEDPSIVETLFDIHSTPTPSTMPVNGILDPERFNDIDTATIGSRFITIGKITKSEWITFEANQWDIVELTDTGWVVEHPEEDDVVVNLSTNKMLRYTNSTWTVLIDGSYEPGLWRMRSL